MLKPQLYILQEKLLSPLTVLFNVFITEYGDNSALYVTNPTNTGFEVRAKKTRGKISTRKAKFS
jgi:hypothetical protein